MDNREYEVNREGKKIHIHVRDTKHGQRELLALGVAVARDLFQRLADGQRITARYMPYHDKWYTSVANIKIEQEGAESERILREFGAFISEKATA